MKTEVTIQEALTELAAAKLKLETMQQLLVLKEQLLSSKDDQINYRFGTHSEKSFELAADTTDWTDSKWSELLPWNIKLIKKSDVSTVLIA